MKKYIRKIFTGAFWIGVAMIGGVALVFAMIFWTSSSADEGWPVYEESDSPLRQVNLLQDSQLGAWAYSDGPHKLSGVSIDAMSGGSVTLAATAPFTIQVGQLFTFGGSGSNEESTGVSVYEVTAVTDQLNFDLNNTDIASGATDAYLTGPGRTSADTLGGLNHWRRTASTLDLYRLDALGLSGVSKEGSFYTIKLVKGASGEEAFYWPESPRYQDKDFRALFAGQTVTIGAYVKAWSANTAGVQILDGTAGSGATTFHTGGGSWEWVEATHTLPSTLVDDSGGFFAAGIGMYGDSGASAYMTQPMLVMGKEIGEGNYVPVPGEISWFNEVYHRFYDYNNVTISADQTLNVEAQSKGTIPKGVRAIYVRLRGECASTEKSMWIRGVNTHATVYLYSQVANLLMATNGWVVTDSTGDMTLARDSTFNLVIIDILGVQY